MSSNVVVIGGVKNAKLTRWLNQIGVSEYNHVELNIKDISPYKLDEIAINLRDMLSASSLIITVGRVADMVLSRCWIVHAALPSTKTKNIKEIDEALKRCKDYLTTRRYYVNNASSNFSK